MRHRLLLITLFALAALFMSLGPARAQDATPEPPPDDQFCVECHTTLDSTITFLDGEERSSLVDLDVLASSSHGTANPEGALLCTDCHGDYPAPHKVEYENARDFSLKWTETCGQCHGTEADLAGDSVHANAMLAGNDNAAVCTDCHGAHDVHDPAAPRAAISQTCGSCHTTEFTLYKDSVHGSALLLGSNPDVPTCINCHGVHNIQDPTTNLFRVRSPLLCANCHADQALMDKYAISTNVFNSYVSDFHGTTVTLFEHSDPNAEVNKAVCYDCHGVHDIKSPNNLESRVVEKNLVVTCQKCHPGATTQFTAAWTSHYVPSPDKYPLVYFVDQFYKILIPAVVAFMLVVVLSDAGRRIANRIRASEPPAHSKESDDD